MILLYSGKPVNHLRAIYWKAEVAGQVSLVDGGPLPVMLLINKHDLIHEDMSSSSKLRQKTAEAEYLDRFCNEHLFEGWEWVSAKTGANINQTFDSLLSIILAHDFEISHKSIISMKGTVISYWGTDVRTLNMNVSYRRKKCC